MERSYEIKEKYILDTINHKKHLFDSASKMALYFLKNNDEDMALKILRRSFTHDLSKFNASEYNSFHVFKEYNNSLIDASILYNEQDEVFLKEHWKNNKHHPEHWSDFNDMTELDIIEMVCDWHSRSVEFGTDLLEFIHTRQNTRFKFDDKMFNKILFYVNILLD